MEKARVEDYIRSIPDFPQKGVIFRDITSVLEDADGPVLNHAVLYSVCRSHTICTSRLN